ncbi:hypothetical protein B0H65DRAFT_536579 [Neurospora tetraspora]|uniref:Uncharacterized protein n=1 Tax=Neurospora tetraspora TaxID=94610 RepID=A0AAE0JQR1_9PEZI|nr:hypothetical protein B0H65DRAFT_536579 [Neurospora tetraspora]
MMRDIIAHVLMFVFLKFSWSQTCFQFVSLAWPYHPAMAEPNFFDSWSLDRRDFRGLGSALFKIASLSLPPAVPVGLSCEPQYLKWGFMLMSHSRMSESVTGSSCWSYGEKNPTCLYIAEVVAEDLTENDHVTPVPNSQQNLSHSRLSPCQTDSAAPRGSLRRSVAW